MKMYVANATQQLISLAYRVSEETGVRIQTINSGSQIALSGDLNPMQADYVLKHLNQYGVIKQDEVKSSQGFIAMIYSLEKPIPGVTIEYAIRRNKLTLIDKGRETRRNAAVAVNNALETQLEENQATQAMTLDKLEATIEEEENRRSAPPDEDVGGRISEAIRVTRNPIPEAPRPDKQRKRGAG